VSTFDEQLDKVKTGRGFIAALDQSGGSTPKALREYGVGDDTWSTEEEMFDAVHAMRTRIITSPAFNGDRILGAILFEGTMDRDVEDMPTSLYLWDVKRVVPFLKIDKGLAEQANGVQLMKPIHGLDETLERAKGKEIFGTKMRSVIKQANPDGIAAIARQQFELGGRILRHDLIPILEPEIDIRCPKKAEAEELLRKNLLDGLDGLRRDDRVILKLTLPEKDDFYLPCLEHPKVLRVVALSGGYSRDEANARLARNHGVIASFSRALLEGLLAQQSDDVFDSELDGSIESIYQASMT
jgi:fructose-bisphosphate aldolase, class I